MTPVEQPLRNPGLTHALCALSCFRRRHKWKERGSRRGLLRNVRVKDWSHYGEAVWHAKRHIRLARAAGWRGSLVAAVNRGDHLRLA